MLISIEIDDFRLDLLSDRKDIRRLINMLSCNLRYMKKSINARKQFYESTEIRHTCNTSDNNAAYAKVLSCLKPRILVRELERKRDLLALDILDENCKLIAVAENLLRILDTAPGHL